MTKFPSDEKDRFIVRMPDGMRERLKEIAAKNGRSLNAEIVARLMETLDTDDLSGNPDAAAQAMKPMLEAVKTELSERYEARLGQIESLLNQISGHLENGDLVAADQKNMKETIAKRESKKRGADR